MPLVQRRTPSRPALILACLWSLLAPGCGAPGSRPGAGAESTRITLRDYRVGQALTIVNDAYLVSEDVEGADATLRRAAFYSEERADPSTKVAEDDFVAQAVRAIEAQGFARHALPGSAPREAPNATTCLEIAVGGDVRHMVFRPDLPRDAQQAYADSRKVFYDCYNSILQFQAADPSQFHFEDPEVRGGDRG